LSAAIKEDPSDLDAIVLLGRVYIEVSDYSSAISVYRQALLLNENNNQLLYEYALLHSSLRKEKEAVMYFELAVEKGFKPDLGYYENLGMAYLSFDIEKGIEILNKVLEKKPKDAEILYQIAQAYYKSKSYLKAATAFYRVYENDNKNAKALYMTGIAYQKKGDKALGNSLCEQAISIDPTLAESKQLKVAF
jgi:Tfp pilus assembly protein PilF